MTYLNGLIPVNPTLENGEGAIYDRRGSRPPPIFAMSKNKTKPSAKKKSTDKKSTTKPKLGGSPKPKKVDPPQTTTIILPTVPAAVPAPPSVTRPVLIPAAPKLTGTTVSVTPVVPNRRSADILIQYPTRNRPRQFQENLAVWEKLLSGQHSVAFQIVTDLDDAAMNSQEINDHLRQLPNVHRKLIPPHSKIAACNAGVSDWDFKIVILASDDMVPRVQGYDHLIWNELFNTFLDGDGLLHLNDGHQKSRICTLTIMGQKYFNRFNYLYHPDYKSLFSDQEQTDVAKRLGRWHYSPQVWVEHQHPVWIPGAKQDELNKRDESLWDTDEATFKRRKAVAFNLPACLLSIQIPAIESRREMSDKLIAGLGQQIRAQGSGSIVELVIELDDPRLTVKVEPRPHIGDKRNNLLDQTRGAYVCSVDDDDEVAPNYVGALLEAIRSKPNVPCVTFKGELTTDGLKPRLFQFSRRHTVRKNNDPNGMIETPPNHLCAVRSDIAKRHRFPSISYGEDTAWAKAIQPELTDEIYLDQVLYHYRFVPKESEAVKRSHQDKAPVAPRVQRGAVPQAPITRPEVDRATPHGAGGPPMLVAAPNAHAVLSTPVRVMPTADLTMQGQGTRVPTQRTLSSQPQNTKKRRHR